MLNQLLAVFALASLNLFSLQAQPTDVERKYDDKSIMVRSPEQTCERSMVIKDYQEGFIGTTVTNDELSWTGSVDLCEEGTISELALNKTRDRINYFRRLVGIQNGIHFSDEKNMKCQKAALMMDAENMLDHYPTMDWMCASEDGITAAGKSNISYGGHSSASVSQYIRDAGANNGAVGHRRWILFPRANEFGFGSTTWSTAMWVIGGNQSPETYPEYVAYPSPGHFPKPLVYPRWSLSKRGANFQRAKVQMKDESGKTIELMVEEVANGYGDNTLVWQPTINLYNNENGTDHYFQVNIDSIKVDGEYTSINYEVLAIDVVEEDPMISTAMPSCDEATGSISLAINTGYKSIEWSNGEVNKTAIADLAEGIYTVTITDKMGCASQMDIVLEDESEPKVLNAIEGNLSAYFGALESYSTDLFENGQYQWSIEGGRIINDGDSNQVEVEWDNNSATGKICVRFEDESGCSSNEICTDVDLEVSSLDEESQLSFKISPNPAVSKVRIESSETILGISLISIDGQIILRKELSSSKSATLDISSFAGGVYFVQVNGVNTIETSKIIVSR